MADQVLKINVDPREVVAAFDKLGARLQPLLNSVSYQTALAVKAQAQRTIAKRRPYTVGHIIVAAMRNGRGYVVMMDDVVKDVETDRRRAMGLKRMAKSKYHQEKHVGLWLERGTPHMRPRPWLAPAGDSQEGPYLQRLADTLDRALEEGGG